MSAENSLEQLKKHTKVVADTGDFDQIAKFKPLDSTTNPSLILAASTLKQYQGLVDDAVKYGKAFVSEGEEVVLEKAMDKLAVNFGLEILKIIPGRVSTEIDARLSFNTEQTVKKGRDIIALYKEAGIDKERVLVKIGSTWEGLQAAKILEQEGIHVNMTLVFALEQAAVAGAVGATLISPFAGRITDFYKQKLGVEGFAAAEDPGVISVQQIFNYFKKHGLETVVMGASFRTKEQVAELCGCDLLTVSPTLLAELQNSNEPVPQKLYADKVPEDVPARLDLNEESFRWRMNENEMADFKLAEGIRRFAADQVKLEDIIRAKLKAE